jgi:hypothetical protein
MLPEKTARATACGSRPLKTSLRFEPEGSVCLHPTECPSDRQAFISKGRNMTFAQLVGQTVVALVPLISATNFQNLKLHGVEAGGIWVESQALTELGLKAAEATMAPKTPMFFLPFWQIRFVMVSLDVPAISEKGLSG